MSGGVRRRARRRRDPRGAHGRGARRARAVRLREVDPAARGRRSRAAHRGYDRLGRPRPRRRPDPQARVRADVPGRPALRAPDRRRQRRLRAADPAGPRRDRRQGRRAARAGRARGVTPTGCPPRSPAASGSGSRSRASLAVEPRLLLLDEPLSALDAGLRERLAGDLRRSCARPGPRRCWSPTTTRRRSRSPTGSR